MNAVPLPIITAPLTAEDVQEVIQYAHNLASYGMLCNALQPPEFCIYAAEHLVSYSPISYYCGDHADAFVRYWSKLGRKPAIFPIRAGTISVLDYFGPEWWVTMEAA